MKLKAPNVFVLIFSILMLMGIMTWIIPAGEFDTKAVKTAAGTKNFVVAGSYRTMAERDHEAWEQEVEKARKEGKEPPKEEPPSYAQWPWHWFIAPIKGFGEAQDVIGFILLVGGAFGVLNATGAIMAFLTLVTRNTGPAAGLWMVPGLMFLFSLGGGMFGMAEETIPFILITVPLAVSLRFDVITGIAIPFIGSQAGFAAAFINPFTLGIAKGIAEQPMEDGQTYRYLCWFIVTATCAAMVTWHAARVRRDPSLSPTKALDGFWRERMAETPSESHAFTRAHAYVLVAFATAMVALAFGAIRYGWYINELCGLFVAMALLCGLLGRLKLGKIADSFVDGAKDLAPAALLVAFARGIKVVADDGKIIDTILNKLSEWLNDLGPIWATECMYAVQTAINFFVPSGSGQAALTMPIMAPLADLVNVPRESAILAYQFGDGFSNMIIPTNAVLVGVLSMAKLDYSIWFKWMIKFQIVLFLLGALLLAIGHPILLATMNR